MQNVLTAFRQQARQHPDNIAIIHNNKTLTYQYVEQQSDRLCHQLQQAGVSPGDVIPLITLRAPEYIIGILAIIKSGASYIPVDIHYPQKRIKQITEQSGSPVILISHRAFTGAAGETTKHIIAIDDIPDDDVTPAPVTAPAPEDTAYVIFTSGTTGIPKGVMVSHASLYNLIAWHNGQFDVTDQTRSTLIAGISFDVAQWEIWSPLICGATLILPDNEDIRLQAESLMHFFAARNITHAFIPTVLVAEFIRQPQPDTLALRYLFTAGEKLNPVVLGKIRYRLIDYYGPTEATIFTTCNPVICASQNPEPSIGRPVAGAEIFILDEQLRPICGDEPGEIFISGPGLARGYLNNPQQTREKFLTLPFAPGKRLYRSGDRARWLADGRIQYLGRLDDQVKIRGNRIELAEIENVLMREAGVKSAVVLLTTGSATEEKKILAFVVTGNVSRETLRNRLAGDLPAWCMPADILILPGLPQTPNGKTDKQALLAAYQAHTVAQPGAAFRGRESELARIWETLLDRPIPGPDDNFFDLGGHSLLAARLASAITAQTQVRAYVRDIYDAPTIRTLATLLEERSHAEPAVADNEPLRILQDDIFLPQDLPACGQIDEQQIRAPRTIFLTGATGFIGSHLLADLLQTTQAVIYCLVRARTPARAAQKIDATLARYSISLSREVRQRIRPLAGDVAEPGFALENTLYQQLCQTCDIVYHSASAVNFIQPYSWMKRDNVQGLREIIRFACTGKTAPLILLSTISVYSWGHLHTGKEVMHEHDDIDQNLPAVITDIGYVRSKWVMEKIADLAASRGLPLMTFRLGYATTHSQTGVSADYQWWGRLVKTCLDSGTVPELQNLREGLTTVDYMTNAIAWISRNPQALGHKFNLIHEQQNNLTLNAFFNLLETHFGFTFRRLPFAHWCAQWENDMTAPLYPLLSLFKDNMVAGQSTVQLYQNTYKWDCSNVKRFLHNSGIREPVFTRELLARYLQHSIGYAGL
ncbi:non-ribosomal peptide synthetase [Shimwellia blattae]|uniref:Putative nonribosomal peptide synthetase n=1 Tax=Shimwellia blattae (strain ATCC 29907 / DSM 4481 / JCM 1650 / NBRC 105725 / CDC 9005-74) TaxID=630626 RepID=I2B6D9_SHIBC|nr:non-ribosomal peptide synthetase [Shimwellia blattae]AFJ46093.1 putative nonribosomal peptide synthetase [Shimwellia blattae DSM 4481 = NBRC 105725]GAB81261.1 hypothetical protein EB105725_12_01610 [Shimwellia blattae DSM 4481 = NBRC 105725]VDY63567.1 Linear gramicidin synthase subunit D [Shimwellia blattae]VEC21589.1 Linear gramicidin synthase subunit D [Shimwellia blattae]